MSDDAVVVVIGGGNMGAALLRGMIDSEVVRPDTVAVAETDVDRCRSLTHEFPGVTVVPAVADVRCAAALLAVKPPAIPAVAADAVAAGATRLLSIAAGVTTATIRAALPDGGAGVDVVRAMPNTPALVRHGVSAVCADDASSATALEWAQTMLGGVGSVVPLDESVFDAVTALTGSGPAYVFRVAEALIGAGAAAGLPVELLESMVTDLLVGSAALLAERGDPAGLRAAVTSPGGTTAAGLEVLDGADIDGIFTAAVAAAAARGAELGRAAQG